jgi:hypothetical protein
MKACLTLALLAWSLLLGGCAGAGDRTLLRVETVRYQAGDDPRWAASDHDDSGWPQSDLQAVDAGEGLVWLRARVTLAEGQVPPGRPTGIYFGALASHELFWDGVRIGRGGVVGASPAEEVPGPVEAHYQVPDALAGPGDHVVAIRTSAHHRRFEPTSGYWTLLVGEYDRLARGEGARAWLALGSLAGMVVTGAFALAMFWINRGDTPFLMLALLCVSASLLLVAEQWRPLVGYTYDWHLLRLVVVMGFTAATSMQLLWLLVVRFPHANGRRMLGAGAALAAVAWLLARGWDDKGLAVFLVLFTLALGWTAVAARRRMTGAALALAGVGVGWLALVAEPLRFADDLVHFSLNFLFVCLLCSHALEVRRERHERHEARARAARLEAEMLRKSIQPHFLMNALTAVSAWIEDDPATAVRLIESLADEFRLFSAMADRRLVPLSQELDLCRSHAATMSLRRGNRYELEVDGDPSDPLVPPGVVHTLVENAITHGAPSGTMTMRLSLERAERSLCLRFESPSVGETDDGWSPGTGTRYIETRLSESYRDGFSFRQGADGAVWRAELTVPMEGAP